MNAANAGVQVDTQDSGFWVETLGQCLCTQHALSARRKAQNQLQYSCKGAFIEVHFTF